MHGLDETLEQKSFAQLRPLVVSSEILAALVCTFVLVLASTSQAISPWLYAYCVIAAGACYLTYRARTTQGLWLTGVLLVCTCTACLGSLAVAIGNPMVWFLPIGLAFSLPVAAMHVKPWHALSAGSAVWATLFAVVRPSFDRQLDVSLTLILITATLLMTTLVCVTFCRIRKNVFDLQHQLHDMAYRDTLTGLPNRRAFMEQATAAVARPAAAASVFFLMLDIDDFKKINDGYGHEVGDRVLVEVARVVGEQSRGHIFARLGGEEFAVVAQVAQVGEAQRLAAGIVEAVSPSQAYDINVSISVGLAAHQPGESLFSLMRRADQALYEAKRGGKNRYAMAMTAQQA